MSGGAGSYGGPASGAVAAEAERLRQQAAAVWGRERSALSEAGLAAGQRLLEVGCGPGGVLERLRGDLGGAPFGVDIDQALLRRAASGTVVRADGAALPFSDGVFDFVLFRLVLRHAPARTDLLREAARVARTGGVVCAIDVDEAATAFDPEPDTWPALKQALAASAARHGGDPFVGRRLRRLLGEAGLSDVVTRALPVTTDDVAPRAFVETLLAPAARIVDSDLLDPSAVRRGWDQLREWASREVGFGYALGWMAAARKPDGWGQRARP